MVNGLLLSSFLIYPTNLDDNTIKYISNDTLNSSHYVEKYINNNDTLINNIIENKDIINEEIKDNNTNIKDNINIIENTINNDIKENIDDNIYVELHTKSGIKNIELEEYLIGVVAGEMPASFNNEALKCQAIVARTYALKRISENKTLTDDTTTQVYLDNTSLINKWNTDYDKYYNKIKNAVISTKGMYLTYNNEYIDAVYHSTSNGYTENAVNVWGNSILYLKSVESYDINTSNYKRDITFTYEELSTILNIEIDKNSTIVIDRNITNRVNTITINNIAFKGTKFRELLKLRSTDFIILLNDNDVLITTYGYGHGVGMSQYGSNEMAKKGYNYKDILYHFYQNTLIKEID